MIPNGVVLPHFLYGTAHGSIRFFGAEAVGVVIHGAVFGNAEFLCRGGGIDIGTEENKFPAVFFFLQLDHGFYFFIGVAAAGVFISIGDDDKKDFIGAVLGQRVTANGHGAVNGAAHGIQKGGGTADYVVLFRERAQSVKIHAVVKEQ